MKDSANAIKSVVNCVRDHPAPTREATREAETPPQTETETETTTISGTGFFVASNFIVTNNHVVKGCTQGIYVRYPDQNSYAAGVSGQDNANDLALLRADMSGLSVVSFRLEPRLGEMVATYGFPYFGILSSSGNFTLGNVTSIEMTLAFSRCLLQFSQAIVVARFLICPALWWELWYLN